MARITGSLGAGKEGRLHLTPSTVFAGVDRRPIQYKVVDGWVDITLPSNPPGTCWLVGWRNQFDSSPVDYTEKWIVPWIDEIDLDELRGQSSHGRRKSRRAENLDRAVWKVEAEEAQERIKSLEAENARLAQRAEYAENKAASSAGQVASLNAEVRSMQRKAVGASVIKTEEKIVERKIAPQEMRQALSHARSEIMALQKENAKLQDQARAGVTASTQLSNLQADVDRLTMEKQHLLNRIEELKQPERSASSLRRELIANLDRLIDG